MFHICSLGLLSPGHWHLQGYHVHERIRSHIFEGKNAKIGLPCLNMAFIWKLFGGNDKKEDFSNLILAS